MTDSDRQPTRPASEPEHDASAAGSAAAEPVGVVGGGQMGSGIAEVALRAGCRVVVVEADTELAAQARQRVERSLARGVERGRLAPHEADAALARLEVADDLHALADRRIVVEAVVERLDVKTTVFSRLDEVVRDQDAVLATNTSSLPIAEIAAATRRPESVVGIHFFNPVPVMGLVELIPSLSTSEATLARARRWAQDRLGKHPIICADRAGFVVNGLLIPYLLAAVRMVEQGVASTEDVDRGMELGAAHPMGPLALCDLIGLDTVAHVAESMFAEFREPLYAPPPLLSRMVSAGRLGRKSGRGFHTYDD